MKVLQCNYLQYLYVISQCRRKKKCTQENKKVRVWDEYDFQRKLVSEKIRKPITFFKNVLVIKIKIEYITKQQLLQQK